MSNKQYLTDSIFLLDHKLYYEDKNDIKEVKNHNWHRILSDYGWEKLDKVWIKKLNITNSTTKMRICLIWEHWLHSHHMIWQCMMHMQK